MSLPTWQIWGERVMHAGDKVRDREDKRGAYLPCRRSVCIRCSGGCPRVKGAN